MLSLLGSLQPDPFSPRHVVMHTKPDATQTDVESNGESENDNSESEAESDDSAAHHTGKRRVVEDEFAGATKKRKR